MRRLYKLLLSYFLLITLFNIDCGAQDLVVNDSLVIEDSTIVLSGNLVISGGGSLVLKGVDLKMNCHFNGEFRIEVEPEGALYIYRNSVIESTSPDYRFAFAVHGKKFEMISSELHGAGWGDEDEMNNDQNLVMSGSKGLIVTTNLAILDSNIFSGNHAGLIIADSGAVISNNRFYDNNAQSLFVRDAKFLSIYGNYILNERGSAAIQITSDSHNRYFNNEIISNHGHAIATGSSQYSIFEKNKLRSELITIFMLGGGNFNIIRDNDILSNEVAMHIWGWNNEIRNNMVSTYWGWLGTGIYLLYSYNCVVEDNVFTNVNEENGIWLRHSSNNLIKNNSFEANEDLPGGRSSGILLFSSCKRNIIRGNSFTGFHRGISIFYSSDNNILYDNTVSSSRYYGLLIDKSDSNLIYSNNTFLNNPGPNVDNGNNFYDYQGDQPEWIKAEVPDFPLYYDDFIYGNEIIENQTTELGCIHVTEGAALTILNSTFFTGIKGTSGLWVDEGGSLFIYNCKFLQDDYGAGFELGPMPGSTFVMKDSEIDGAGFEWWYGGLNLNADSMVMEGNRINETTINFVNCKNTTFRNNLVTNMYCAINLHNHPSYGLIENNIFDGAFHSGINSSADHLTIRNNSFRNIRGPGINLYGGFNNIIEGDTLLNFREPFYSITAGEDGTKIRNNVVKDSYMAILSGGSGSTVTGNKVFDCGLALDIPGDQLLDSNYIAGCRLGINVRNSNVVATNNVITECDTGIFLGEESGNNRFYQNDFILNEKQAFDLNGSQWDNDSVGNFWSDYFGPDEDGNGIGDIPYQIQTDIFDRYPLMTTFNIDVPVLTGVAIPEIIPGNEVPSGGRDIAMFKISLQKTTENSTDQFEWSGLQLDLTGTISDEDISNVKIYRDVNSNVQIETDTDLLLGSGIFDDGKCFIQLDVAEVIYSDPSGYLVAVDIPDQISLEGRTIGMSIKDSSYLRCRFPAKFINSNFPFSTDNFIITDISDLRTSMSYSLSQNLPNPFSDMTMINFCLPVEGMVSLEVYDNRGKKISIPVNQILQPGCYNIELNVERLKDGIYFYRFIARDFVKVKKFVVIH